MCMTKAKEFTCPERGIAYKVFDIDERDRIYSPYYHTGQSILFGLEYVSDLTDIDYTDESSNPRSYKAGYHLFVHLEDAKEYAKMLGPKSLADTKAWHIGVFQIYYDVLLARGEDCFFKCITARKMTVQKEIWRSGNGQP